MNSISTWKKYFSTHSTLIIFGGLAVVVFFFYRPILGGYFISDDYSFMSWLLDHAALLRRAEHLGDWFFASGSVFLRPVLQWFFLFNFITWDTNASGYYLTNIVLHTLNVLLVYLLALPIMRNRWGALTAALLFALHPIHAESVSWIVDSVDLLATFFCLLSMVFFVLFRQRSRWLYYGIALISFVLATLTKESTLTLPAVLLAYDLLFTWRDLRWDILKAQLPIWCILPSYVALRFLLFGKFGGYSDQGFLKFGWELFVQYYPLVFAKPFLSDIDFASLLGLLAFVAIIIVILRTSQALWLGLAWMIFLLIPAGSANYVAPRLAYISSVGLAITEGAAVTWLFTKHTNWSRGLALGLLTLFTAVYSWSLAARVDDWAAVGNATRAMIEKTRALHPAFPSGARLYYVGVPQYIRGIDVYAGTFPFAFKLAYLDNPTLWVKSVNRFPIVPDQLEQTFFFEYRQRQVIEHPEVRQSLLARRNCLNVSLPAAEWNFIRDAQGWEPWNQLTDFGVRDGTLVMRSSGDDPFMGGPDIDLAALSLGEIEITMRVRADDPTPQGQVYWLAAGALDFSPDLQQTFPVQADGEFHTYRVDLAATDMLSIGDRITRLRLDPIKAPAEIAIKMIRVFSHCASLNGNNCQCK